jgi:hypothetical protein
VGRVADSDFELPERNEGVSHSSMRPGGKEGTSDRSCSNDCIYLSQEVSYLENYSNMRRNCWIGEPWF